MVVDRLEHAGSSLGRERERDESRDCRKLVRAIESRDVDALAEVFADDAVLHHPLSPKPLHGQAAIVASEALFDAFSDVSIDVLRVVTEGEDIAGELVIHATNTGPL